MSDHPNTSSIVLLDPHHPLLISTTSTTNTAPPPSSLAREYRKGNWTLHETLILITAKKMDDERRARSSSSESKQSCKTAELRWKWVENYCWNHGCLRSQNQCNDKWDNLLRDYKKVRDYETRPSPSSDANKDRPSYWKMEKHERKEKNLPSNLIVDVFQALHEVVNRRYTQRSSALDVSTAVIARPAPPPLPSPPPPPPPLSLPPPPQPQQSPVSGNVNDFWIRLYKFEGCLVDSTVLLLLNTYYSVHRTVHQLDT